MLNFGALIAFMGVNLAALVRYYVREKQKRLRNLVPPVLGFAVCLLLWLNLSRTAQIAGSIWMAAGIAFGAWKTRGFRGELVNFEIPAEDCSLFSNWPSSSARVCRLAPPPALCRARS